MLKKIAYIVYSNENATSGVLKKITTSINTWQIFGIQSKLFILTSNKKLKTQLISNFYHDSIQIYFFNSNKNKIVQFKKLINDVINFYPNIVYYRYHMFLPGYLKLASKIPVIIEVNTNDIIERKIQSKIIYIINKFTRNIVFKNSSGIIFVSPELPYIHEFSKFKKPFLVLGNSIDTSVIPWLRPTKNKTPQLIYMGGSDQPWQGMDKIFSIADLFPEWIIHVIGLSNTYNKVAPSNIKFYGFLEFDQYVEIMQKADCAIGTLALHRKQMNSTSALKILEYLSFGLPVILGYQDTNLPEEAPYILRLPNVENNIISNKSKIEKFVYAWLNKRVPRNITSLFDTKVIEDKRIKFFKKILKNR